MSVDHVTERRCIHAMDERRPCPNVATACSNECADCVRAARERIVEADRKWRELAARRMT